MAFFVAMALRRARQAAGETLTGKLGLPESGPLLSTQSPVSPHFSPLVAVRRSRRRVLSRVTAPSDPAANLFIFCGSSAVSA